MSCLILISAGAEVRTLNFKQWFGSGIIHTKMWLIDRQHFYVGSANLDWRSLTQVDKMTTAHQIGVHTVSCRKTKDSKNLSRSQNFIQPNFLVEGQFTLMHGPVKIKC